MGRFKGVMGRMGDEMVGSQVSRAGVDEDSQSLSAQRDLSRPDYDVIVVVRADRAAGCYSSWMEGMATLLKWYVKPPRNLEFFLGCWYREDRRWY